MVDILNALLSLFRRPSPAMMAARELASAELELLQACSASEYAISLIGYHDTRCKRLRKFLAALEAKL